METQGTYSPAKITTNIVQYEGRAGNIIKLDFESVKKYLVHGKPELITTQEMVFFMGICKARRLDPFAKDCYLIKYSQRDPAAIITSIDYFRARARAQKDCTGWKCGVLVVKENGDLRYSKGIVLEGETLIGGWFAAKPKGWDEPMELELNLGGYIKKTNEGFPTAFWKPEKQASMISKVAESQGLRKVWPDEFGHVYLEAEVEAGAVDVEFTVQGDNAPEAEDLKSKLEKAKAVKGDLPEGDKQPEENLETLIADDPDHELVNAETGEIVDAGEPEDFVAMKPSDIDAEIHSFWLKKPSGMTKYLIENKDRIALFPAEIMVKIEQKCASLFKTTYEAWVQGQNKATEKPQDKPEEKETPEAPNALPDDPGPAGEATAAKKDDMTAGDYHTEFNKQLNFYINTRMKNWKSEGIAGSMMKSLGAFLDEDSHGKSITLLEYKKSAVSKGVVELVFKRFEKWAVSGELEGDLLF